MKSLLVLLIILTAFKSFAGKESFSFDRNLEEWGSWGDGVGLHDPNMGHLKAGSMWLSCDWGEVQTLHYRWSDLKPGNYKVTVYVRAKNVQSGSDNASFWSFYDGGAGTKDIFVDLSGSYEWRKIEFSAEVKGKELSLWFRLKAPGQVWVDDLSIQTSSFGSNEIKIAPAQKLTDKIITHKAVDQTPSKKMLLDFDKNSPSHPFPTVNKNGNKLGRMSSQKYYNFDPRKFLNANWSKYDHIEMDIYNGTTHFSEFFLTLADEKTSNYWSQVNHKTHLAPGWNHLSFSLTQYVGERGSHRFLRGVNLSHLTKIFVVTDLSEKYSSSSDYYIDNISLSYNPAPPVPTEMLAFDFTSHKDPSQSGFTKITSQDIYQNSVGAGFVEPRFWRVEDAQWAPSQLRYSIGLLGGSFRVKLPNGKYKLELVIDRLGYWDPSFWQDRMIYLNGVPAFKESRSFAKDYLKDLLIFENTVPSDSDDPFDLYLRKILRPIELNATVSNGLLDIKFEGDATGINLNTLVVWKNQDETLARKFLKAQDTYMRQEFSWLSRGIKSPAVTSKDAALAKIIAPHLELKPTDNNEKLKDKILWSGGNGESSYDVIQLRGPDEVKWEISDLVSETKKKIEKSSLEAFEIVPQYISPDLNHETYMVAGKYLSPLKANRLKLSPLKSTYLLLKFDYSTNIDPGLYRGEVTFTQQKTVVKLPIELLVKTYELPTIDFPVGFFGPDPVGQSYFPDPEMQKLRRVYQNEALKKLGEAGFTTFSGLPKVELIQEGDEWLLDTSAIDQMMSTANRVGMSKVYFSYGGKFPQELIRPESRPQGLSEEAYWRKVSPLLAKYLNQKGMPEIIHTFSDEAGGYSNKVTEDVSFGKKLKEYFPFLQIGGFTSKGDSATSELRSLFDFAFYSNVTKSQMESLSQNWGSYNASPGNLDDPRYTFGPGLYLSRKNGLSYYLEWHSSSVNNFPYYDLDGRESDVTMFLPRSDGSLFTNLRFEFAAEGIQSFRKLMLLEDAIVRNKGTEEHRRKARNWLDSLRTGKFSSDENVLKPNKSFRWVQFSEDLNNLLSHFY